MWLIYALLAAITWGLSYTLDERVFKHQVAPVTLLACQAWLGAIVFTLCAWFSHFKNDIAILSTNRTALGLFLTTLIIANIGAFFIAASIQARNATFAALIEQSYPIFTILFNLWLFKENNLSPAVMIGGCLIIAGALVISLGK